MDGMAINILYFIYMLDYFNSYFTRFLYLYTFIRDNSNTIHYCSLHYFIMLLQA